MNSKLSHGMEKTEEGERWSKRSLNNFSKAKGQVEKKKLRGGRSSSQQRRKKTSRGCSIKAKEGSAVRRGEWSTA